MAQTWRFSKGSPMTASVEHQQAFVRAVDRNKDIRDAVETLLGVSWDLLNFNQKIAAIDQYQTEAITANALAGAARSFVDLIRIGQEQRDSLNQNDMIASLVHENRMLREQRDKEIVELQEFRRKAIDEEARRVAALHSDEEGPGKSPRRQRG